MQGVDPVEHQPNQQDQAYVLQATPKRAYKIASARWRDDELLENWKSLQELTDAIKDIVENETVLDVCPSCESF